MTIHEIDPTLGVNHLIAYKKALRAAISDTIQERRGVRTRVYVDNDVVIDALKGSEAILSGTEFQHAFPSSLVRALWSSGFFGQVCMLWPHVTEMWSTLERMKKTRSGPSVREVRSAIFRYGVHEQLRRLELLAEKRQHGSVPIEEYEKALEGLSQNTFVILDALSAPSWESKLRSLMQVLVLGHDHGPLMKELAADIRMWPVVAHLRQSRHEEQASNNTVVDAAAIVSLMAVNGEAGPTACVRFYSQTKEVRRTCCQYEVAESLWDPWHPRRGEVADVDVPGFVVRSPMYFFVRGVFPILAINAHEDWAAKEEKCMPIEELMAVSNQLDDIAEKLQDAEILWKEIGRAVTRLAEWSGQAVAIVEKASRLSFAQTVWLDSQRRAISVLAKRFREMRVLEEMGEVDADILRNKYQVRQREQMVGQLGVVSSIIREFNEMENKVGRVVYAVQPGAELQPFGVLAIARWCGGLNDEGRGQIVDWMQRSAGQWAERSRVVAELSRALLDAKSAQEMMVGAVVAWSLGMFEMVAKALGGCRVIEIRSMPEAVLLRLASECICSGDAARMTEDQFISEVDEVDRKASRLGPERQASTLLAASWACVYWLEAAKMEGSRSRVRAWGAAAAQACRVEEKGLLRELRHAVILLLMSYEPINALELESALVASRQAIDEPRLYLLEAQIRSERVLIEKGVLCVDSGEWATKVLTQLRAAKRSPLEPYQVAEIKRLEAMATNP